MRAQRARGLVTEAVVGAGVDVDQVLWGWRVEALVQQLQLALVRTECRVRYREVWRNSIVLSCDALL